MRLDTEQATSLIALGVFILGIGACKVIPMIDSGRSDVASEYARQYASDMNWDVQGLAPAGADTDGDGYVSVSVSIKSPLYDKGGKVISHEIVDKALLCGCGKIRKWYVTGCKVPVATARVLAQ